MASSSPGAWRDVKGRPIGDVLDARRVRVVTRAITRLATALFALAVAVHPSIAANDYEPPPVLPAKDLAPATLLAGQGFTVDPKVPTDGLLGRFTIRADVGTFTVSGRDLLAVRVAELPAIRRLKQTSRTKAFLDGVRRSAARPLKATGNIVRHPVETVKGLPAGVGRFFDRVQAGGRGLVATGTDRQKGAGAAEQSAEAARDALGFEQERRLLAKELEVDPYTTNAVLAKQLDEVAWVAFSARLGVDTLVAVAVPGSIAIAGTSFANDLVWDTPRGDLVVRDEAALETLGVPPEHRRALAENRTFPLSVQTALVRDLERLSGVRGRADVVALAATVTSEVQARFVANAVRLLAQQRAPLAELSAEGTVVGWTRDGQVIVPGPVDWLAWTEKVARFARRDDLIAPTRTIMLTGRASPRTRQELEALGWTLREGEQLEPGP